MVDEEELDTSSLSTSSLAPPPSVEAGSDLLASCEFKI